MIFVNFKTYPEATGEKAIFLAKACQEAQAASGVSIRICVQAADILPTAQAVDLPVWAQHIDPVEPQKATGFITALSVKQDGAVGTLLNHSEHPLDDAALRKAVLLAKQENLEVLIFAKDVAEAVKVSKLDPEFLAIEEPSLVGTGKAMVDSKEGKEKISRFLTSGFSSFLLVGAGISSFEDVFASIKLGAKGVVISSKVVLSSQPQKILEKLAAGFKSS